MRGRNLMNVAFAVKYLMNNKTSKAIIKSVHEGKKTYECVICGKVFDEEQNLSYIESVLEGRKPYECSICGKVFDE